MRRGVQLQIRGLRLDAGIEDLRVGTGSAHDPDLVADVQEAEDPRRIARAQVHAAV